MNYADIKRLVKLVETSNISELEIEEGGDKLRIVKQSAGNRATPMAAMMMPPMAYPPTPMGAAFAQLQSPAEATAAAVLPPPAKKMSDVLSPMVGTFYRASSAEAPPYVQPGDLVKPGQVLCIIEAMKLMNEIEAEVSGRVMEIAAQNAQPVEFGQLLFRIEPA